MRVLIVPVLLVAFACSGQRAPDRAVDTCADGACVAPSRAPAQARTPRLPPLELADADDQRACELVADRAVTIIKGYVGRVAAGASDDAPLAIAATQLSPAPLVERCLEHLASASSARDDLACVSHAATFIQLLRCDFLKVTEWDCGAT